MSFNYPNYEPRGPLHRIIQFLVVVGLVTIFGFGMYCGLVLALLLSS